jgi:hypothetical protein
VGEKLKFGEIGGGFLFKALTYWKLKKGTTEDLKIFCSPSFV